MLLGAYARADRRDAVRTTARARGNGDAGSPGVAATRISQPPLQGRVEHLGYVEPDKRRDLYASASMLVLPSHLEGFGLPVLEAMTIGVPVIVSRRGALPEVVRRRRRLRSSRTTSTGSPLRCSKYLGDPALAEAAIERGRRRAPGVFMGRERANTSGGVPKRDSRAPGRRRMSTDGSLRIGIDARELLGDTTGVGRYLGELLRRWVQRHDAERRTLMLYTPEPLAFVKTVPSGVRLHEVVAGSGRGTWWEQTHLRRAVLRDAPDVFFARCLYCAARARPAAGGHDPRCVICGASRVVHAARRRAAAAAHAPGRPRRVGDLHGLRILVSTRSWSGSARPPNACESSVRAIDPRAILHAAGLVSRSCSLSDRSSIAGGCPPLTAFSEATAGRPDARLIIAGADRSYPPMDFDALTRSAGIGSRVELLSYVTEAALDSLYARASVFVFLSEYEGFGLTPLEALSAGVPIVVLDTPVAREVYGDGGVVRRRATTRFAARAAPSDGAARRSARSRSAARRTRRRYSSRYSWERAAEQTLAAHRRHREADDAAPVDRDRQLQRAKRIWSGCLASLAAAPPATPHEIVVVDNASTDGSADAAGSVRRRAGDQHAAKCGLRCREQRRHSQHLWRAAAAA